MTKRSFYYVFLIAYIIIAFSGCQLVMDYHLDECDNNILDSSDTKNHAVSKHDITNTDGLYAQASYDSDDYIVCSNKQFRGDGYIDSNGLFQYFFRF